MTTIHKYLILMVIILTAVACKQEVSNINIEQVHNPDAHHIIAPGMGTIGLIQGQQLYVFFLNEKNQWIMDKTSQFNIPENNNGIIALGMGNIGVISQDELTIYRLDQENKWTQEKGNSFKLPRRYDRVLAVKMPWEMGIIAFEMNGFLEFYYLDQHNEWKHDETASFRIPEGIDDYFSMGNMTIAVTHENKLGLYYLHPEGEWRFLDHETLVLKLPEDYLAIIPFEPGTVALLRENMLNFYQLNLESRQWIVDRSMDFYFINSSEE